MPCFNLTGSSTFFGWPEIRTIARSCVGPATTYPTATYLYRGDPLRALTLQCANCNVIPEILLKLQRGNPKLRILEVPFQFERRVFGESKRSLVWFVATYLWTLVRLRFSAE